MAEHHDTQAILGKDLIVRIYYNSPAVPAITPMEIFEPIEVQAFSPTKNVVDVTSYSNSRYRDTIPGLLDNVDVTVRGNYAISDDFLPARLTYTGLWEWFRDEEGFYGDPLDMLVIYPKYTDDVSDPHGYHAMKVNITSLEIDPPMDAQMTYTAVFTTSGPIEWRHSTDPQPPVPSGGYKVKEVADVKVIPPKGNRVVIPTMTTATEPEKV